MDSIKEKVDQIEIQQLEKGSEHWVDILHIEDPHHFYVRLTKYKSLIKKIENFNPTTKPPNVKMFQIVLYNLNKNMDSPKYARGRIMNIKKEENTTTYSIISLDYGPVIKDVYFEHIWVCDPLLLEIPGLALNCQLAHCAKREESWGEAIDAFKYFASPKEQTKMVIESLESDKLSVELYNSLLQDLATLLALLDYTTLGYVHSVKNQLDLDSESNMRSVYKFKDLEANDSLHVRVLSGKTLESFFVADVNDYRTYLENFEYITHYSKKQPKLIDKDTIKNGDIVSVSQVLRNVFERGIVKEVLDKNQVKVHMVDSGIEKMTHFRNIRMLPKQCMTMPVVALYCSAEEAWTHEHYLVLQPGKEFIIEIQELGNGFDSPNKVKIYKI